MARSFINNGKKHEWNLSKETLEGIAGRENYKYEDTFATHEEASDTAKHRSMGTWRCVTVWRAAEGFVVCSHGVQKQGWEQLESYRRGQIV